MGAVFVRLKFRIQSFLARVDGQDLVEYALVVALAALGATSAMKVLGTGLNHGFSSISSTLVGSLT